MTKMQILQGNRNGGTEIFGSRQRSDGLQPVTAPFEPNNNEKLSRGHELKFRTTLLRRPTLRRDEPHVLHTQSFTMTKPPAFRLRPGEIKPPHRSVEPDVLVARKFCVPAQASRSSRRSEMATLLAPASLPVDDSLIAW
jgi:hypothetical protein